MFRIKPQIGIWRPSTRRYRVTVLTRFHLCNSWHDYLNAVAMSRAKKIATATIKPNTITSA